VNNYPRHEVGVLKALLLGVLFFFSASAAADQFKPFTVKSFEQIKARYAGQELLVVLWSVDCPPCLVELDFMRRLVELNPELPCVLISTDLINDSEKSSRLLEDFGLSGTESWMFADSFVERLRFSIDANWYGELPRSYFFDVNNKMRSHSGIVSKELLAGWFTTPLVFE
jgi:hypothetical protein